MIGVFTIFSCAVCQFLKRHATQVPLFDMQVRVSCFLQQTGQSSRFPIRTGLIPQEHPGGVVEVTASG